MPAPRSGWRRLGWILAYRTGAILLAPGPRPRRPEPEPLDEPLDELPENPSTGRLGSLAPLTAALVVAFLVFVAAYGAKRETERVAYAAMLTGGRIEEAPNLLRRYGCAGCHQVPGVRGPGGRVGPPLDHLAARVYIAGMATNTPENLVRWIVDPKSINPRTAMPVTGISEAEARHVAAYLLARR